MTTPTPTPPAEVDVAEGRRLLEEYTKAVDVHRKNQTYESFESQREAERNWQAWRNPNAFALLRAIADAGFVIVPKEPTEGLLMSMAIRYDHALGIPGYYDQKIMGCHDGVSHAQKLSGTLTTMRQLHEEVVGGGFYSADKEDSYRSALSAALKEMGAG